MRINTLFYTLAQGVRNIFRNKWFSLASIATISACLFLFGLVYSVVTNFQHIVKTAEEGVSITVFFEAGTSDARIAEIGQLIQNRPEVSEVVYISAEEVWEEFSKDYLKEYSVGFPDNPLQNSLHYEVFLSDVSLQSALVTYLESMPEIRRINYSEITATTLTGVNMMIGYVSIGIIIILLAVSVFLISNTVTIGISVRKEEINIMKYIGATDFFVRSPFVIEGILIGLIGAAIPMALIYGLYNTVIGYMMKEFPMLLQLLNFLTVNEIFRILLPVSLIIGIGIGFFGSFNTVRKHLRV